MRTFYKSMFWICAETGIRGGELCALKVEDLNFDYRALRIRRSVWKGELQTTKSKKGVRTFAISTQLCEHLKTYLLDQWRDNPEKLLFCTREATPYDNREIVDQVLHPILERLGIARAGLHAFRHGNATIMDGLNAPMRVRQDRLGHEKAETTLGYTHQSVGIIEELPTKSARFFAQLCPNRLRLKHLSSCQYNEIRLKVFAQEEGAVPKW